MQNSYKNDISVLICRAEDQASEDLDLLKSKGYNVFLMPTIKIVPLEISDFSFISYKYDFFIFTSQNSVNIFFNVVEKEKLLVDNYICIGKKTKLKLEKYGFNDIITPDEHSSEGLIEYFRNKNLLGKNILIPGSKISNPNLVNMLKTFGANVQFLPIYDTIKPNKNEIQDIIDKLKNIKIDLYIFTSPSTFSNFIQLMEIDNFSKYFNDRTIAAIGAVTKKAIEKEGLRVDIMPEEYNMQKLINSVDSFFSTPIGDKNE